MKNQSTRSNMDWLVVTLYIVLVVLGWLNIYSSSLSLSDADFTLDLSQFYGKQLLSIGLAIPLIFIVPEAGFRMPLRRFSRVVFPEPLAPIIPSSLPSSVEKLTLSTAVLPSLK